MIFLKLYYIQSKLFILLHSGVKGIMTAVAKRTFPTLPSSEKMAKKFTRRDLRELEEGEMDAANELEDCLKFDELDNIFHDWKRQIDLDPTEDLPHKQFANYNHRQITYRSQMSNFIDDDGRWTKIRLSSNDFRYYPLRGTTLSLDDLSGCWLLISQRYLGLLRHIQEYARRWCGNNFTMVVFYNRERELTMIKCRGTMNLLILFEHRLPYEETADMANMPSRR